MRNYLVSFDSESDRLSRLFPFLSLDFPIDGTVSPGGEKKKKMVVARLARNSSVFKNYLA